MHHEQKPVPAEQNIPKIEFSQQIMNWWKEHYPESFSAKMEEMEQEKIALEKKELNVNKREALELLKEYGVNTDGVDIEVLEGDRFRIEVSKHFSKKRLPDGYAYKGGAARALLLRNLNLDLTAVPRDIDIMRINQTEPSSEMDKKVMREFAPEDSEHSFGGGMENTRGDYNNYFTTRDFTINEAIATDHEIIATKQCVFDTIRKIIRLTEFETEELKDSSIPNSKLLAKTLRLYIQNIHLYGEAGIEFPNWETEWEFERDFISPFYLSLHLDKACQVGSEVAREYVKELSRLGQIPQNITEIEDAAEYLASLFYRGPFYYRHAPRKQFQVEERWLDEEEDFERKTRGKK